MAVSQKVIEELGIRPFDLAEYLDSDDFIVAYISEVLADGDNDELLRALGHVARARGMSQLAKDAGIGRESLYKSLTPGAKPRFETINRVLNALGVGLRAEPIKKTVHSKQVAGARKNVNAGERSTGEAARQA